MAGSVRGRAGPPGGIPQEDAERESESRFRAALDASIDPCGIYSAVRDERGRIVDFRIEYVNEAMAAFGGVSVRGHAGHTLLELFPAHRDTGLFDAYVHVVETGEPLEREFVAYEDPHAGGGPIAVAFDLRAARLGDGYVVSGRDVSAHARAQQALVESEQRYRTLVEQAADGILVSDSTGRYVEANPAICRMLGYSREELLERYASSLSAADDPISPQEMDLRLEESSTEAGLLVERRYRRRDGTSLIAEVSFSQLPDGRQQRNIRDISARVAAEAERTRLVSAVEQTADSIWMQDIDGNITYVNPAFTRTYGYEPGEVVGQFGRILDSGRHGLGFFAAIWSTAAAGRTWTGSITNRRKDGSLVEVEAVISAIRDGAGQLTGFVQADRDVSRERQLEGALKRDARERETIEAALARIDPGATPEAIAAAACAELVLLAEVDSAWVVALGRDPGRILAVTGPAAEGFPSGERVPQTLARYLLERAESGPWGQTWQTLPEYGRFGQAITATGLHTAVLAPLRGPSGVVGVIGFGTHDPANAGRIVERLPALATFGSIIGALIAPALEVRHREDSARASVQAILDARAFAPFFQPIVELHTGDVVGYEALTRFADGSPPNARFAAAVRSGLGIQLEVATLTAAVEAAAVLPPAAYLSLNVSPGLIHAGPLGPLLAAAGRPIILEITEHVAIDDYPALRRELAALGPTVRPGVDDAGAGYASFRHILELAPAVVKLDIELIRGIDGDPARQALLAGMTYFAVKRRIRLIAEGIETPAELETLRSLAIPFGQGFLLGRPQDGRERGSWPVRVRMQGVAAGERPG
jgi:PAS domain S-box-containing protein